MKLKIKTSELKAIEAHALSQYPQECCGLLKGKSAKDAADVEKTVEADNVLGSPVAFEVNPEFIYRQYKQAEEEGVEIVGIYHSHPDVPARLSFRDLEIIKFWPGAAWLILSVTKNRVLERRAYLQRDDRIEELELVVS